MSLGIEVVDLVAGWGPTVVLDGISLAVRPGGTLAVLGRNGAGKTTLLAAIIGLANHRRGAIRLGGELIDTVPTHRRARRGLGYVPQEREIFPSLTVEENLVVAALPGGWAAAQVFECSPRSSSVAARPATGCRAASSRCWRSDERWSAGRRCCCSMSR